MLDAAGHAVAVFFHSMYERGGPEAVAALPGGATWLEAIEAIPPAERHLVTHEGHLVRLTAPLNPSHHVRLLGDTVPGHPPA